MSCRIIKHLIAPSSTCAQYARKQMLGRAHSIWPVCQYITNCVGERERYGDLSASCRSSPVAEKSSLSLSCRAWRALRASGNRAIHHRLMAFIFRRAASLRILIGVRASSPASARHSSTRARGGSETCKCANFRRRHARMTSPRGDKCIMSRRRSR